MTVVAAVLLDLLLKEPPAAVHPVRLMGCWLSTASTWIPAGPRARAVPAGAAAWAGGLVLTVAAARAVERVAAGRRGQSFIRGAALWAVLSIRLLCEEVAGVEAALSRDVAAGREAVGRLVSRPVDGLTETEVRQAALESLAENLSDSFVAPLCWFSVGGLPAAVAYRYVNTADAVWGYRDARWQWGGFTAARADDLANLIPARLTGLLLAAGRVPLRRLPVEARRTPSPNAGWPMAALALRQNVRLAKWDSYELNAEGRSPTPLDTRQALAAAGTVAALIAVAASLVERVSGGGRSCRR